MDTVKFLEQLAQSAHHRIKLGELIGNQPDDIRKAFQMNDAQMLKRLIDEEEYSADMTTVVKG